MEKPTSWKASSTVALHYFFTYVQMLSVNNHNLALLILSTFSKAVFTDHKQPIWMVSKISRDKNGRYLQPNKTIACKKDY